MDVVSEVWETEVTGCISFQIQQKLKLHKPVLKQHFQHTPIQVSVLNAEKDLETAQNCLHADPTTVDEFGIYYGLEDEGSEIKLCFFHTIKGDTQLVTIW